MEGNLLEGIRSTAPPPGNRRHSNGLQWQHNRGIQLIIDDYKLLKGKYLVYMLSYIISQCDYEFFSAVLST